MYVLFGTLIIASAWADAVSMTNVIFPTPPIAHLRPPSGANDSVVEQYYDYQQKQAYSNFPEKYHFEINTVLVIYGILAINIAGLYVFVYAWYTARLRKNDLYPIEVYNGYITERGSPFDYFNYYVWTVMGVYCVVYIVLSLVYAQLY